MRCALCLRSSEIIQTYGIVPYNLETVMIKHVKVKTPINHSHCSTEAQIEESGRNMLNGPNEIVDYQNSDQ